MVKRGDTRSNTPHARVVRSMSGNLPETYKILKDSADSFHSFRLYARGQGDYLAVIKRYGAAGDVEVCFGNGGDPVAAFLAIEGAVRTGRWQMELPWAERRGR